MYFRLIVSSERRSIVEPFVADLAVEVAKFVVKCSDVNVEMRTLREEQVTQHTLKLLQLLVNRLHMTSQRALLGCQIVAQLTSKTNELVNRTNVLTKILLCCVGGRQAAAARPSTRRRIPDTETSFAYEWQ